MWTALVGRFSSNTTRAELLSAYAETVGAIEPFSSLSALVYRLSPKVRLM
jgi:hypothetical protein